MRYALLLAACSLYAQTFDPKMPDPVPAVTGKVVEAATLRYIDVKSGDGDPAAPGKEFTVHYTGWLRDGTQFDSSLGREPIRFVQGRRQVIAGWDVGFEGLKVGGKRRLFIPYQFAYGEQGRGSIPPKAELIFDVELLAVKDAAPVPSPAADLLLPFGMMEQQVTALAREVPEEKYGWRPGPGVRSFREVFLHIAYGNQLMLKIGEGLQGDDLQKTIDAQLKAETEALTKEQVLQKLAEGFAAVRSALEGASAAALAREVNFFGTATTQRGILTSLDTHIAEHLGQAIAYSRMNGIVPPWSK
ncbi:MAG TPA: DinB family protein [Candidatus Sulfopaludibacter sp.]|nr:DinB family protein [Candidatus Sulfopaludibacter sp.]